MVHKRSSEMYFTFTMAAVLGVVLALFAEPGRYLDSPGLLVILCAVVGFSSARRGDGNAFDKYTIAASIVGAVIGGLIGYATVWWAKGVVAEGGAVVWVLFLPAVFGLTSVVSHFVGSLNSGLRKEDEQEGLRTKPAPRGPFLAPGEGMSWKRAYERFYSNPALAADSSDLHPRLLQYTEHETLVVLRQDRLGVIWAYRLWRNRDFSGPTSGVRQMYYTDYAPVRGDETVPLDHMLVVLE